MMTTKLAEALKVAGIDQRDVDFDKAIALAIERFIASGGTNEGAAKRLQGIVERMSEMGQLASVDIGQKTLAQTRLEDEGAKSHLSKEQLISSSSSSTRDGKGRNSTARRLPGLAQPVREPSRSQISAAASVAKVLSVTVLDTFRVRDGRSIGDVRFGEIERLRCANAMEASVFRQIQRKFAFADGGSKLRDLLSADDLNAMKQRAAEIADAQ